MAFSLSQVMKSPSNVTKKPKIELHYFKATGVNFNKTHKGLILDLIDITIPAVALKQLRDPIL